MRTKGHWEVLVSVASAVMFLIFVAFRPELFEHKFTLIGIALFVASVSALKAQLRFEARNKTGWIFLSKVNHTGKTLFQVRPWDFSFYFASCIWNIIFAITGIFTWDSLRISERFSLTEVMIAGLLFWIVIYFSCVFLLPKTIKEIPLERVTE